MYPEKLPMADHDVVNAVCSKIYKTLNAGDTVNPNAPIPADSSYVSFLMPGASIDLTDLRFGFSPIASEIEAASAFADFVNNIPNTTGFFRTSQRKLYDEYKRMLQEAILAQGNLSQAEEARLKRATEALYVTTQIQDIVTGDLVSTTADTPFYERYSSLLADYQDQLLSYNARLINVQTNPGDPLVVADFNINGPIYRSRVRQAFDKLVSSGSNTVETAIAVIDQLTGRDPVRLFADARDRLNSSRRFDLNGQEYYFTKYFPTSFVTNPNSFQPFTLDSKELSSIDTSTSTSWGGGANIGFGLWSFGANASYSSSLETQQSDSNNFSLKMELGRIALRRSWFTPNLLSARSWKFPDNDPTPLSDGGIPPKGALTGYITELILARNVEVGIDMTSSFNSQAASRFNASGSVGWGPFRLRGGYTRNTSRNTSDFSSDAFGIKAPGIQIIGAICQLLPKSPNPDPGVVFS